MADKQRQVKDQKKSSLQGKSGSSGKGKVPFVSGGEILIMVFYPLLVFLIYAHTLESPFVFDDVASIPENLNIRLSNFTLEGLIKAGASSRPVATISFALNYYFHQYDVIGYHLINILIHITTGILLYFFVRATLSLPSLRSKHEPHRWIAFFAAFIWLVHPIQIQSVTYIVQRMNSLAAMFFMLSLLLYIRGRMSVKPIGELETRNSRSKIQNPKSKIQENYFWYGGSAFAWLLALGCKENTAVLPFFIFLYEWYFFQDLSKEWIKRQAKYILGIVLLFAFVAYIYLGMDPVGRIAALTDYGNNEFTITERALTQFRVVIYYLSLLLYPHPSRLNLDYDFPLSHSLIEPVATLLCLFALIGLVGMAVYGAKRERLLSFCMLWFLGNLIIESSIIPLAIIYEHRMYMPSMLISVMAVSLVYRHIRLVGLKVVILVGVVLVFSVWTYERNKVWSDDVTLWRDCVKKSPHKARPHLGVGVALEGQGSIEEAIHHFSEALRINPGCPDTHNSLANALMNQGKVTEAVHHYTEALRHKPHFAEAHNNLGNALLGRGGVKEAVSHYAEALRLKPEYVAAHYNLGNALARQGKFKEAKMRYAEVLRLSPGSAEAHYHLGNALLSQGAAKEAVSHYTEALRFKPGYPEAHYHLGNALLSLGKMDQAIPHFSEAIRLKPRYVEAHNNLGIILARQGGLDEAIRHFSEALRLQPNFAEAHYNLGVALADQGEVGEAVRHYTETLRLKPDHQRARKKLDALSKGAGAGEVVPRADP